MSRTSYRCRALASILCVVLSASSPSEVAAGAHAYTYMDATLSTPYQNTVKYGNGRLYHYSTNKAKSTGYDTLGARVFMAVGNADASHPVVFVVRQRADVASWEVPSAIQNPSTAYLYNMSKTICLDRLCWLENATCELAVEVSTTSEQLVSFEMRTFLQPNFTISMDKDYYDEVDVAGPKYYLFNFPDGYDKVLLIARSDDTTCMVVTATTALCPNELTVADYDEFKNPSQSMTKVAAITIPRPTSGRHVFIMLDVPPDNSKCIDNENYQATGQKSKTLKFNISLFPSEGSYREPIAVTLVIFIVVGLSSVAFSALYDRYCFSACCEAGETGPEEEDQRDSGVRINGGGGGQRGGEANGGGGGQRGGEVNGGDGGQRGGEVNGGDGGQRGGEANGGDGGQRGGEVNGGDGGQPDREANGGDGGQRGGEVNGGDGGQRGSEANGGGGGQRDGEASGGGGVDGGGDPTAEGCVTGTLLPQNNRSVQAPTYRLLVVSDLHKEDATVLHRKYYSYVWTAVNASIFYFLPAIQLVLTVRKRMYESGDDDICYYNFLCARPYRDLHNFNNVFSNFGYMISGFCFILAVLCRSFLRCKRATAAMQEPTGSNAQIGMPQYYGIYYTMGWALIVEGAMSLCYHICPSSSNFQFDTAFMFVMGGLVILRIYQSRHPDNNPQASTAFVGLASLVLVASLGMLYNNTDFNICFTVLHILFTILVSIGYVYSGSRTEHNETATEGTSTPSQTDRCCKRLFDELLERCRNFFVDLKKRSHNARENLRNPGRLLTPALIIVWNGIIEVFEWLHLLMDDVGMKVLIIVIGSLAIYIVVYLFTKCFCSSYRTASCRCSCGGEEYCGEKPWVPSILLALSIGFWIPAGLQFKAGLTDWKVTAAQSRAGNRECVWENFYDDHDVWHLLSAAALFFSFMAILHLDDDVRRKPAKKLYAF